MHTDLLAFWLLTFCLRCVSGIIFFGNLDPSPFSSIVVLAIWAVYSNSSTFARRAALTSPRGHFVKVLPTFFSSSSHACFSWRWFVNPWLYFGIYFDNRSSPPHFRAGWPLTCCRDFVLFNSKAREIMGSSCQFFWTYSFSVAYVDCRVV